MTALLLTWDVGASAWDGVFALDVERVRREGSLTKRWPGPTPSDVEAGADVWLMTGGDDGTRLGLLAHGFLVAEQPDTGSSDTQGDARSTKDMLVSFDRLLDRGDEVPLPHALPTESAPGQHGGNPLVLTSDAARMVRSLWSDALIPAPGSADPLPGSLPASALRVHAVNRFETDPDLRRVVLAHRGSACHACDLDVDQKYGVAGVDIVQLHLVTPLHLIDDGFQPDVLVDLVPLCPTCHVVAHGSTPDALGVTDLRRMLRSSGFLRGSVVMDQQLEAEESARRILDAGT